MKFVIIQILHFTCIQIYFQTWLTKSSRERWDILDHLAAAHVCGFSHWNLSILLPGTKRERIWPQTEQTESFSWHTAESTLLHKLPRGPGWSNHLLKETPGWEREWFRTQDYATV